ncbi:MAG: SH3 domain-containing protein [Candidatus Woesebacteria bacterium]
MRKFLLYIFLCGVLGVSLQTVLAGSGTIPTFTIDSQLNGNISVTCPGSESYDWRVGVDDANNTHVEQTNSGSGFRLDGTRISNGHHNAIAQVHCKGEDWSQATESRVGFDWYGGNPTPVPPPVGYEVSISLNVSATTVTTGANVGITAEASCTNTNVRGIRLYANGVLFDEETTWVVTSGWSSNQPGTYVITADAACSGDDSWKTSPNAQVTVTVQQGATSSGGGSSTGTAGNPVTPPQNSGGGGNSFSQFRLGSNGLDVDNYCQAKFGQNGSNDGVNPNTWGCGGNVLDHDSVCREIWGSERPYAWMQGGLAGWSCETSPQPGTGSGNQNPQPQQTTNDVGQVGYTSAPGGQWVKVVTGMLNVRSGSGTQYSIVAKAPLGRYFNYISTSNGWYNVSWNGGSGWVSGGSSYTTLGSGADNGSSQPAPVVNNPNPPATSGSCGVALATRLVVGQKGRNSLVEGDTRVRNEPSGTQVDVMLPGETFDVLEGPVCRESNSDGYLNWWKIRVDVTGIVGWSPEGNSSTYWLEPYQALENNQFSTTDYPITMSDGASFTVRYEHATFHILNGADFVIWEINRLRSRMDHKILCVLNDTQCNAANLNQPFIEAFTYNVFLVGEVDVIKGNVENTICGNDSDCRAKIRFVIGNQLMDTSGPGNITFGYTVAWMGMPQGVENVISNIAQIPSSLVRELTLRITDYPDDINQRLVGRHLFEQSGENISSSNVTEIANTVKGLDR